MGSLFLLDLADVCRSSGWPVVTVDGWESRARGSGGFSPGHPSHLCVHHTASGSSSDGWPDVNYICHGDDDAPLANLYLARDGTIYVCAAGATNTNGSGQDPCGWIPDDTMNTSAIGIEAGNNGTGELWPDTQLNSYAALCSVLCTAYSIPTGRIHAHWEYAVGRKIDPAGPARYATGSNSWDMTAFRTDTAPWPVPEPPPEPEPEDDMANRALLISSGGGSMPGAVAVTDYALRAKTFVSADDAQALNQTGQYDWITLAGATFDGIPGTEAIDIVD